MFPRPWTGRSQQSYLYCLWFDASFDSSFPTVLQLMCMRGSSHTCPHKIPIVLHSFRCVFQVPCHLENSCVQMFLLVLKGWGMELHLQLCHPRWASLIFCPFCPLLFDVYSRLGFTRFWCNHWWNVIVTSDMGGRIGSIRFQVRIS